MGPGTFGGFKNQNLNFWEFFKKIIILYLLIFKIFTLSTFHSPMCRNGRNFTQKKRKTDKKIEKLPEKGVKMQILKNGFRYFSNRSNFDINSKFQQLSCLMAEEIVNKHIIFEVVYKKNT